MKYKIPNRYRTVIFALIMSLSTALIVSGTIIYLHTGPDTNFMLQWFAAFIRAWPIAFAAILVIAPIINKLLDIFVETATQ